MNNLDANIKLLKDIIEYIIDICSKALDREEIVAHMVGRYGIKQTIPQYYLAVSTVSAFLSHMSNEGMLITLFEENKLKFIRR